MCYFIRAIWELVAVAIIILFCNLFDRMCTLMSWPSNVASICPTSKSEKVCEYTNLDATEGVRAYPWIWTKYVWVCKSVRPLQITLGVLFINLPVSQILAYCWKFDYFIQPHECFHALCAHNLIIECFWYCLLAFLQHVCLECSYFVHVWC